MSYVTSLIASFSYNLSWFNKNLYNLSNTLKFNLTSVYGLKLRNKIDAKTLLNTPFFSNSHLTIFREFSTTQSFYVSAKTTLDSAFISYWGAHPSTVYGSYVFLKNLYNIDKTIENVRLWHLEYVNFLVQWYLPVAFNADAFPKSDLMYTLNLASNLNVSIFNTINDNITQSKHLSNYFYNFNLLFLSFFKQLELTLNFIFINLVKVIGPIYYLTSAHFLFLEQLLVIFSSLYKNFNFSFLLNFFKFNNNYHEHFPRLCLLLN